MPEKKTLKRARKAKRQGKSSSTQAGEFVREEIHHVRRGKHGAKSTKQAIAIGLSKARRAGGEGPEGGGGREGRGASRGHEPQPEAPLTRKRLTREGVSFAG